MKKTNDFQKGLKDGLPICFGYFSVAFAFGIFCLNSGLSIAEAVLISLSNVTSAGQLAGVPIICGGGSLIEMAATQLIINSRYALMSVSLSQKLGKDIRFIDRFWIGFVNTDEVFAVSISQKEDLSRSYMAGLILTPYLGWSSGTLAGAICGDILPQIVTVALGIAIYGMFVAIVVPVIKEEQATLLCVLLSIAISCFLYFFTGINSGFAIILCALISSTVMSLIKPYAEGGAQ